MRKQPSPTLPPPIGERRTPATARRKTDAYFQSIFEQAFNGIILFAVDTRALTNANPAFLRMTGYTSEDLPGLRLDDLFPPTDAPEITASFGRLASGEVSFAANIPVRKRDGSLFRADINGTPFELRGGRYVLGEFRDLTAQIAAEEALRAQEAKHQRIYDSMLDAFAMVDMSGRIIDCNQTFQDMLGYTAEELKRKTYTDLTPEKWHALEQKIVDEQIIPLGQSAVYEKEYKHRDGRVFPVELKTVLLRDQHDHPEAMWAIIRDISERKNADAALRASEERFRSLLWNIPSVAVQGYGFDGTTHYWNRASEQLYGYTPEEAIGRNLLDLIVPPEMVDGIKAAIQTMIDSGQPIPPAELSLMHKDGSRVAVYSSHAIVRLPGQPPELFCIDIDLSKPKLAEEARRQTERRLSVALKDSPVAVFEQDLALRYTWTFNHPQQGYLAGDVLGKTDCEILDVASASRLTAAKQSVLKRGKPAHLEAAVHPPGGTAEYYDLHIEPRFGKSGGIVGLIGAAINVTKLTEQQKELSKALAQRQWAEAVLREREEQLALFVEYAPASIAMFDRKMHYLAASRRWIREHGISRPDIRGYSHYDLLPDLPDEWKAVHSRCLAGAIERADEDSFLGADGKMRTVRWVVHPWLDNAGMIGGIIIFSEDITEITQKRNELAKAKAEAEQANAAKSQFLAAASHDLRQPLHALDLYVGIIADSVPPEHADIVANMKQCSANLSVMLNELLDLSKLDAGAVPPRLQDFPLAEFLCRIANTHAPLAEQKDLLLRVARTRQIACSDPQLLQQLVNNLVSNAIRYTHAGGVLIGIRRREGSLWIEVWDTGIGIPDDKQKEIFEPFKQLGNPERNREAGTGLGLALVERLARLLGVRIRVASRPGRGSMFAVEVARGAGHGAQLLTTSCQRPENPAPLRVALVEDDPQVLTATQRGLQHLGHKVVAAASTENLLAELGHAPPDIVIADYRLAGHTTGVDAICAVRRHYGDDIKALIITGDTDPEVVQGIAGRGFTVLNKPLLLDDLKSFLNEISARPRSGRQP